MKDWGYPEVGEYGKRVGNRDLNLSLSIKKEILEVINLFKECKFNSYC